MVAYLHVAPPPGTSTPLGGHDTLALQGEGSGSVLLVGETARPAVTEALIAEGFEPVQVDGARAALARLGVEAGMSRQDLERDAEPARPSGADAAPAGHHRRGPAGR
ncbi:hypothetical protein [Corallococcus sp. 4LFB]|uniref:hypothetical protein n=1 Tax=Corallococcus sp. 4LFB TaxID=3383249 RepID=UPI003974DB7B